MFSLLLMFLMEAHESGRGQVGSTGWKKPSEHIKKMIHSARHCLAGARIILRANKLGLVTRFD